VTGYAILFGGVVTGAGPPPLMCTTLTTNNPQSAPSCFVQIIDATEDHFAVAAFSNQRDFKGGTTGTRLFDYGLVNFANGASYAPAIAGGNLGMTGTATDGSGPWVLELLYKNPASSCRNRDN
jgi:hypothetical protein